MNIKPIILALFVSLVVFVKVINPACATDCRTTITVRDSSTNYPIQGATVTWNENEYTTNFFGQVIFYVPPGDHTVTASAEGYDENSGPISCPSCGNSISGTIYLTPITTTTTTTSTTTTTTSTTSSTTTTPCTTSSSTTTSTIPVTTTTTPICTTTTPVTTTTTVPCCTTTIPSTTTTTVPQPEEVRIELGDLDVDPDEICIDEDETIDLSIPVTLESGPDNTDVIARFYVEEDGDWDYIGRDEKELDEDQTRTFEIEYDYNADDLEEGRHDVRVVVEAEDDQETEYADLDVEDCDGELRVSVGYISLDPSDPDEGDIVEVKVPVTLESSEDDSDRVYVYAYIDDDKFYQTSKTLDEDETESFRFTFDTDDYSTGSHRIKVKAKVDDETDTSTRSFSIGRIYGEEADHCLVIDNIRLDKPLQPGMSIRVLIDVMSCGSADEDEVKAKVEAFSKTYYTGYFDIVSRQTKEVYVTFSVPDDVSGKQTIRVTAWNDEISDTWSKDFVVSTGIPFIEIEKEFTVAPCETEKIKFVVINTGGVSDTFSLKFTGVMAEWITGVPEAVTLEPDDRKTVTAYVTVPCDTELGYYEFTITAEGSPKYSATSSIRVARPWAWPTFALPTGLFWVTGIWSWLPWLLLLLFIIIIIFLLAVLGGAYNSRRRPMFDC